jgi:PhnB protein
MHGQLVSERGYWLMGSDTAPGTEGAPANSAVSISGDDGDALRGYFERLAEGGQITVPLEKQMWGDEFGMLTDRFGISWMVNIGQPEG